jgi:hypothetical protein
MEKKIAVTIDGKNIKAFCKHHKEERSGLDLYELPFCGRISEPADQSGFGPDRKNSGIQGLRGKSGSRITLKQLTKIK